MPLQPAPSLIQRLVRCWRFFKTPYYAWVAAILGMLLVSVCEPLVPALLKPLLDKGFVSGGLEIWMVPVALIGIFVARGAGSFIAQVALAKVGNTGVFRLRMLLFEKLQASRPELYAKENSSSINNTMIHEIQGGAAIMVNSMLTLGRDSLTLIALLSYLIYLNWQMVVVVSVLFPVLFWTIRKTSKRLGQLNQLSLDSNDRLSYAIEENVMAYREIRLQGAQEQQSRRFHDLGMQTMRLFMKAMTASALITPLTQILSAVCLSAVISFALLQSSSQGTTVGGFAAFVTGMLMLVAPIKHLSEVVGPINRSLASLERAIDFLERHPNETCGDYSPNRVRGAIDFQSVTVVYPQRELPALQSFTLSITPGATVALVGSSGSGKTTLVNLLPRWLDPSKGQIMIDGVRVQDYDLKTLRRQIAMVSQQVVVMNDTVFNNVSFGQPPDRERAQKCLESANLGEWLTQLPQGMDSIVGHNASLLSGGQRQRLAIARAMYKDAPILILDEATSALDNESERLVQEALSRLCMGRTTLVIAHRLSTIQNADRIVVMDQGQIIEQGNHAELIAQRGVYWNYVQLGERGSS